MNAAPQDFLVFEDSPEGITAAGHAGMYAVALPTSHTADELAGVTCDSHVADYDAVLTSPLCLR